MKIIMPTLAAGFQNQKVTYLACVTTMRNIKFYTWTHWSKKRNPSTSHLL